MADNYRKLIKLFQKSNIDHVINIKQKLRTRGILQTKCVYTRGIFLQFVISFFSIFFITFNFYNTIIFFLNYISLKSLNIKTEFCQRKKCSNF